jgi:internalin A
MKSKVLFSFLISFAVFLSLTIGCSDEPSPTDSGIQPFLLDTTHSPIDTTGVVVRKPNIYLYPETKTSLSVRLVFSSGGTVTESVPEYSGGWQIEAEPNGKINNTYNYLFYECRTPDLYQYNSGWIIKKDSLLSFFQSHLAESGFSEKEINDFIEYWIPRLAEYPYYIIYPQFSFDIEKLIQLKISPSPDNLIRLYYVIKGSQNNDMVLSNPPLREFKREGFVAAEWGVVLK